MTGSTISSTSAAITALLPSIEPPGPRRSRPGPRSPALPLGHKCSCDRPSPALSRPEPIKLTVPTGNPRTLTVDKNAAYPAAVTAMKREGELWRFSRLRQVKYLNNIVEQDHRRIKRLVRPGLGFGSLPTARRTLAGYEGMAMIRKGQVRNIGGC